MAVNATFPRLRPFGDLSNFVKCFWKSVHRAFICGKFWEHIGEVWGKFLGVFCFGSVWEIFGRFGAILGSFLGGVGDVLSG